MSLNTLHEPGGPRYPLLLSSSGAARPGRSRDSATCDAALPATLSTSSSLVRVGASLAVALVALLAILTGILAVVIRPGTCTGTSENANPSAQADDAIPAGYLSLYRGAGRAYGVPWPVLAGIGAIETDHGRADAPGVHSGRNSFGCCAGPMQFNLTDGPPSTWDRYAVDGNHDGHQNVYDPADAIPSAANYLHALIRAAGGDVRQAILGYNHSEVYVNDVLARAETYSKDNLGTITIAPASADGACTTGGIDVPVGPVNLQHASRLASPRAYRTLPGWAMAAGHPPNPSTPASTTTSSGSCAATTYASAPHARTAITPTVTAPPST